MLTQEQLQRRLSSAFDASQAALLAEVVTEAYAELVKTHDFNELKEIVRDLAQAQNRTEQRMDTLAGRMDELTQAQSRTEQRMDILAGRMDELAQAQVRTEHRMDELAQAQARTEESVRQLSEEMRDVKRQVGGLATTVGYRLEDKAYRALPDILLRDHQLVVRGRLKRGYIADAEGRSLEINIIGDAIRDGQPVKIIGECKSQLSIPNIDRFIRRQLSPLQAVYSSIFPVLVTYMVSSPEVEAYAQEQGIALYYSYDFLP
jgi:exonuclease VII large subunit